MTVYINLDNMTEEEAMKAIEDLVMADKTLPGWKEELVERQKQWGLDTKILDPADIGKLFKRIERGR
jgi:hypothetical protein